MDIMMPVMNGYEATKMIRSLDREDAKVRVTDFNTDGLNVKYQLVDKGVEPTDSDWSEGLLNDGVFDFETKFDAAQKYEKELLVYATDFKGNKSNVSRYEVYADLTKAKAKYTVVSDLSQIHTKPDVQISAPDNPDNKVNATTRVTLTMGDKTYASVYDSADSKNIFDFDGTWYAVTYNEDKTGFDGVTALTADGVNELKNFYGTVNVKFESAFADLNLGDVKEHDIDAFGDAYEYLMTMYASNAGKSGGEFFTPADVSELLTRLGTVGKKEINKVYDPACGSGSLLLKAEKVLGRDAVRNGFFGQEINITTYNLCRINMFLHDIEFDKFDIACEDTLTNPQHWDDEPFELIVSNPPYSIKWAGDENPLLINDPRFAPAGVLAPKSKADLAFIMHSLAWLASNGTAAIVCFPGIMYRGGAEQKIRKYLVDNNFIDCIIQLPSNLFFGTSIATCIMVLKKGKTDNKVLFIDASSECVKVTNNNKLTQAHLRNARADKRSYYRIER